MIWFVISLKKNCEITKFQEEKKPLLWIHHKIGKKKKKNIDVNIKSQEAKDLNKSIIYYWFLETNGKINCKERHHKERVEGPKEEKRNSTKAKKFTKIYYHSKEISIVK